MRPDIKKRREKYNTPTLAQQIFQNRPLLLERPSGMNFADYSYMRYYQSKLLRELFRQAPNKKIASRMVPKQPSLHLQNMVLNARIAKENRELDKLPKEEEKELTQIDKIWNWFRKITDHSHGSAAE